jgi:hypothetical protein
MSCRSRRAFVATSLAAASALVLGASGVDAQTTTPGRPTRPSGGGFSPFRGPGVKGTSFEAASLEQPGCPLHLAIEGLRRTERGVTISLRLSNLVEGAITRHVVGAWVLVPDGTVRGYQKLERARPIDEAVSSVVDLTIRNVNVMPNDVLVLAVQEARGEQIWRRDVKELEKEVRDAILR